MQLKDKQKQEAALLYLLLFLSAAAAVVKLFIGFDIDEGYAIAMPYRLLSGDRLFGEMWEIHQTSSLLPAFFMKIFLVVTGSAEGIVLYLRIVTTLIHVMMTALIWHLLTVHLHRSAGSYRVYIPALIYFNLLPKWMVTMDFSMQQVWGMTLLVGCLCLERRNKKTYVSALSGIALGLTVLGYPGMLLLYPALLFLYLFCEKDSEIKTRIKKSIIVTLVCGVMALLFLGLVLRRVSLHEFAGVIPNLLSDGSHSLEGKQKLLLYISQWANVAKQWLVFAVAGFPCGAGLCFFFDSKKGAEKSGRPGMVRILQAGCMGVMFVTSLLMIFGRFVGIAMGPFHFQARLLLIWLLMMALAVSGRGSSRAKAGDKKKSTEGKDFPVICHAVQILTTAAFLGILAASNVGPAASSSYLVVGIVFMAAYLLDQVDQVPADMIVAFVAFTLSLLMCKGFYVRYTEYFPADILQKRIAVTAGPQKGIYLLPEDWQEEKEQRETVNKITSETKSATVLGTDQILSLSADSSYLIPSTISTPAFDSQWIRYFTQFVPSLPEVVFISKNTVDDREKFFKENEFGKWLADRYEISDLRQNGSICWIYLKR